MNRQDYCIADRLPESLNRDNLREVAQVIDEKLHELDVLNELICLYPRIDELSSELVDALAIHFHVDFYDTSLSLDKRRALVKNSIRWHMKKGTKAAVEELVQTVFESGIVSEWFEYGGEPYHFRIVTSNAMYGSDSYEEVVKAINTVKNVRSWLEGIIFGFQLEDDSKIPQDEKPEYGPGFDMEDNYPLAKRLYGTGLTYGDGYHYSGAVDHLEAAVILDINEDNYTVARKCYGEGRTYNDGGEPYGGTLGPADRGGEFTASVSIDYGEGMTYGASTQFYGTGHLYDGSIVYGDKARVYGGWRLEEDIS